MDDKAKQDLNTLNTIINTHRITLDNFIDATNGLWAIIQCMLVHERINTGMQIRDTLFPDAAGIEPHGHEHGDIQVKVVGGKVDEEASETDSEIG